MSEKHLVCKGATVYCSKSMVNNSPGTAVPLNITSQTLVEINGGKTAATDKDCMVANMCFGTCNSGSTPPPPCAANVMWSTCYEDAEVTAAGLKFLTEESEATCMLFGGKVKIAFHGQLATPQPEELQEVVPEILSSIIPIDPNKDEEVVLDQADAKGKGIITRLELRDSTGENMVDTLIDGQVLTIYAKVRNANVGDSVDFEIEAPEGQLFANNQNVVKLSATVEMTEDGLFAIVQDFEYKLKA